MSFISFFVVKKKSFFDIINSFIYCASNEFLNLNILSSGLHQLYFKSKCLISYVFKIFRQKIFYCFFTQVYKLTGPILFTIFCDYWETSQNWDSEKILKNELTSKVRGIINYKGKSRPINALWKLLHFAGSTQIILLMYG